MHISRNLFLLSLLLTFSVGMQAQLVVTTPCPIVIEDTLPGVGHASAFTLQNTGTEDLELAWRKTDISVPEGWTSYLCDPNNCYGPDSNEPISGGVLNTYIMAAGEVLESSETEGYVLRYGMGTEPGTLIYEMEIYDVNDPSISITCEVHVTGIAPLGTSVDEVLPTDLTVYPNPANEMLMTQAPAGVDAWLLDMTGRRLANIPTQGLDVSSYPDGLYMVNWMRDGQSLLIKPVVVSH